MLEEPVSGWYPHPDTSRPHPRTPFLKVQFQHYPPTYAPSLLSCPIPLGFPTKSFYTFSPRSMRVHFI
jgi:hypothetical protein